MGMSLATLEEGVTHAKEIVSDVLAKRGSIRLQELVRDDEVQAEAHVDVISAIHDLLGEGRAMLSPQGKLELTHHG